jgi:hypothetical protein
MAGYMNKYAIFQLVELKKNAEGNFNHEESTARNKLDSKAKVICASDATIEILGAYCWLLPLPTALSHLSALIDFSHTSNLEYRVAYLNALEWLEFNKK